MRLVSTLLPLLFVSRLCLCQEVEGIVREMPAVHEGNEMNELSELNEVGRRGLHNMSATVITVNPKIPKITEIPVSWGRLRNESAPMWTKFGRGEKIIGGFEAVAMTALICMPKQYTNWSATWVDDGVENFKAAFTKPPVWDEDGVFINYVSHPICGSYYYNVVRSQNATMFQSFAFTTAQSIIWEYVIEGVAERPSTQDLIVTPIAGAIIGEATHRMTMNMRRNGFSVIEKVFVILFNPMFALNNGFGPRYNPVRR